ncbi:MAG: pyridoxal phosphate-dependent aminotransferase [Phycisphaerae bacterium]|nr:pyridoxal phosphate-dependent aminotransferase [Phycisphaerae bacterium]
MRRNILHEGSGQLTYEIRKIVAVANRFKELGVDITWENIGDPIEKGEVIPDWIKDIIVDLTKQDKTYGYVATQGVLETRQFLADKVNEREGAKITADDILFFNGLGDAVARIFGGLKREARVMGPSPAYSTHSSAEAAHSGYDHLTYELQPENGWMPDLEDIENKVRYNDSIAGLLIINPDNPTGAVYPRDVLIKIIDIARRYDLFVMFDEIYTHIVYNGAETVHLSEIIGEVAGIALRGISKEYPWPGSRCGWIEVYNQNRHPAFKNFVTSLINSKMLEVCSTSLPQYSIPLVMGNEKYIDHLNARKKMFEQRSVEAWEILSSVDGVFVSKPQGAFYMSVLFDDGVLNNKQFLEIENAQVKEYLDTIIEDIADDKRFVYYLLASKGICVVPLTGFCCKKKGFRVTLLETDDEKRKNTWNVIAESIKTYLASA